MELVGEFHNGTRLNNRNKTSLNFILEIVFSFLVTFVKYIYWVHFLFKSSFEHCTKSMPMTI